MELRDTQQYIIEEYKVNPVDNKTITLLLLLLHELISGQTMMQDDTQECINWYGLREAGLEPNQWGTLGRQD